MCNIKSWKGVRDEAEQCQATEPVCTCLFLLSGGSPISSGFGVGGRRKSSLSGVSSREIASNWPFVRTLITAVSFAFGRRPCGTDHACTHIKLHMHWVNHPSSCDSLQKLVRVHLQVQ